MDCKIQNLYESAFSKFDLTVQRHMLKVYAVFVLSAVSATGGAAVHLYTDFHAGFSSFCAGFAIFMLLIWTPDNHGKNMNLRLLYSSTFAGFTGLGAGPLLESLLKSNSQLVTMAFVTSALIFVALSIVAVWTDQEQMWFLSGTLVALMTIMLMLVLANLIMNSVYLYEFSLVVEMLTLFGFVVFDTQSVIEKAKSGNLDFVRHGLDLFLNYSRLLRVSMLIARYTDDNKIVELV